MTPRSPTASAAKALLVVALTCLGGCEKSHSASQAPVPQPPPPPQTHLALRGAPKAATRAAGPEFDQVSARLIAFGDSGSGSEVQYRLGRVMGAFCRTHKCDFAVHTGDIIYPEGILSPTDPGLLTKLEKPYEGLGVPLYLSLGNHDHFGNADAMVAAWADGAPARTRGLLDARLPARYYTFSRGGVRFLVLDTDQPTPAQEQWALQVLARSRAAAEPWVVAVGHHPRRSTGLHGDATQPQLGFLDRVLCHRVDVYLSGHDHDMELMPPTCGVHQVVTGAADSVRLMRGGADSVWSSSDNGWALLEFRKGTLELTFYDERSNRRFSRKFERRPLVADCAADRYCDPGCPAGRDPDCR